MRDDNAVAREKAALRARMLDRLRTMSSDERTARSEMICARVVDSVVWKDSRAVVLFAPLRTEPQIASLEAAAVAEGKSTFIIPQRLRVEAELQLPFAPDLILVPGLAFSASGHRLGRGGGIYDRLLGGRGAAAHKLAICFAFQRFETIPIELHDVVMNAIISD